MSVATDQLTDLMNQLDAQGKVVSTARATLKAEEGKYGNLREGVNVTLVKVQDEAGEIDKAQSDVPAVQA